MLLLLSNYSMMKKLYQSPKQAVWYRQSKFFQYPLVYDKIEFPSSEVWIFCRSQYLASTPKVEGVLKYLNMSVTQSEARVSREICAKMQMATAASPVEFSTLARRDSNIIEIL